MEINAEKDLKLNMVYKKKKKYGLQNKVLFILNLQPTAEIMTSSQY